MTLAAKKSLGQHFLVDAGAIRDIVDAAPEQPSQVVEIGPGRGALLQPLLKKYRRVIAVEMDDALAEHWRQTGPAHLQVLHSDASQPQWLAELPAGEFGVVGNLPYNISTAILRLLLLEHARFPWLLLMFQREVADRIQYAGERNGGPLGVLAQMAYRVRAIATLQPGAFQPPPQVQSKVLRLTRRDDAPAAPVLAAAWPMLLALFNRRRARLDSAVVKQTGADRQTVQSWFAELAIRTDARPDHVSPAQYKALLAKMTAY